jgi:tight adherence protein C
MWPGGPPPRSLAIVAVAAGGLLAGVVGLTIVGAAVAAFTAVERSRRGRRQRQLIAEVAEGVPLLQLAVHAGLTVRASLVAAVPWLGGELAAGLAAALERSEAGGSLADALEELPQRLGRGVTPLTVVLASADRYGAPLAEPLARVGAELRLQRRRQLESAARRLPVKLLLPLVVGVLPAFVLLVVVPLLVSSLDGVSLTGG